MKLFVGKEQQEAERYMERAAEVALSATCKRSRCGCVIVKDGEIIGEGFNSPPKDLENQRRCQNDKTKYGLKVTDKTCCIHAEERALLDALKRNSEKIEGSRLYFIRLDKQGKKQFSEAPYCTLCSKLALDTGVAEFLLWHERGITSYETEEYNDLSFEYHEEDSH